MNEENLKKPIIGISSGELNGIGLEVIIKALSDDRILNFFTPIIYCHSALLNFHRKSTDVKTFNYHIISSPSQAKENKINVIQPWSDPIRITYGIPDEQSGQGAFLSLKALISDAKEGLLDGIITSPIDKANIQSDEFNFPGHTEYLAKEFEKDVLMLMVSEDLILYPLTGHIALQDVSSSLDTNKIITKITLLHQTLQRDFLKTNIKIAILGLNPHAGENGLIGKEEKEVIIPAIEKLQNNSIQVFGPYSADGFFGTCNYKDFDAVVSLYHDQGLIPFKMIAFESGVNYTAGLPIPRVSPDHGTAYNIAGKNLANEGSFRQSIFLLIDILKNRKNYDEANKNPLRTVVERVKENE
jgi:4-hydroxythreonine-4-phosphate dehydrogenase